MKRSPMSLNKFNRCRIEELQLTPDEWRLLRYFLEQNLVNALSPMQLLLERYNLGIVDTRDIGEPFADDLMEEAQYCIDLVLAVLDTLEEVASRDDASRLAARGKG